MVQYDVTQALLRRVEAVQHKLVVNVEKVDEDYNAACEALSIMKKLRRMLDQYKTCWQDEEKDLPEG